MQAGFIGLGTMGASMAANLQKGLKARGDTLVVHDIKREAATRPRVICVTAPSGRIRRKRLQNSRR